ETRAVRAERQVPHCVTMPFEVEQVLAGAGVPNFRRVVVIAGGGDALPVRAESNAEHSKRMATEIEKVSASAGIPHFCRSVITGRGEALAVRAEHDLKN